MAEIPLSDAINVIRPLVRQAEAILKVATVLDVVARLESGIVDSQKALTTLDEMIKNKRATLADLDATLETNLKNGEEVFDTKRLEYEERIVLLQRNIDTVAEALALARSDKEVQLATLEAEHQQAVDAMNLEVNTLSNTLAGLREQRKEFRDAALKNG